MDMEYLKHFIPYGEMAVIRDNLDNYADCLERVERQLRSCPEPLEVYGKELEDIRVYAHYFGGASDWWIYALESDWKYAEAFVCLNGDVWNAEMGPLYIRELLPVNLINLDLHWNDKTTLKQVIEKVEARRS